MSFVIAVATLVLWVYYASKILTLPAEYGYVGVILITAFTYTLLRLRFLLVVLITVVGIAAYLPYAFTARYIVEVSRCSRRLLPGLVRGPGLAGRLSDGTVRAPGVPPRARAGPGAGAIRRPAVEHPAAGHRRAAQDLLRRADRRGVRPGERVFVDAVGSTEQAARSSPEEFADALDELFRRFDQIADRHGLEKIKTIGDAYMAVAGAPVPMADHADAAVAMALEILDEARRGSVAVRRPDRGAGRGRDGTGRRRGHRRTGSSPTTCGATP